MEDVKLKKVIEPPHRLCEICKDDDRCLNNETHKDYEKNNEDFFWTDYLDCVDYLEIKNNTRGEFIKGYVKKLQEEKKNKEPYESGFVKWSKQYS